MGAANSTDTTATAQIESLATILPIASPRLDVMARPFGTRLAEMMKVTRREP
jgi:hypothetical protein